MCDYENDDNKNSISKKKTELAGFNLFKILKKFDKIKFPWLIIWSRSLVKIAKIAKEVKLDKESHKETRKI